MNDGPPRVPDDALKTHSASDAGTDADATPGPPAELAPGVEPLRQFTFRDRMWIARLSGKGACGTGSYGLGLVEAVHFCDAAAPDRPLFEALVAYGRFGVLFDSELAALLNGAVPVVGTEHD